jgi:transposase
MPQNFLACDREQELLLAPSLREWLAEDHFAWFVIDAIDGVGLAAFLSAYRADGHGRAAHDPAMMVALLMYAYAIGERSSRRIERRCREDVALRVITANQVPDHATVARFGVRHEEAPSELSGQVLGTRTHSPRPAPEGDAAAPDGAAGRPTARRPVPHTLARQPQA